MTEPVRLDNPPALKPDPVTPVERRWVLVFAALVLLATSLPYLAGFGVQGSDFRFTGFVFGVQDGNSYIAKMLSGSFGAWLFRSPYSAYPQQGMLVFLPYLLLGKLAAPPGLHDQLVALYHLYRIGAGLLVMLAVYDFLANFIAEVRLRRFGLALAVLGGGLGWLLALAGRAEWLGSLPLDFYSPETFGFLGFYGIPHLSMARALSLWALLAYLRANDQPGGWLAWGRQAVQVSGLWLLAGVFQPLALLTVGVVMAVHLSGIGVWLAWRSRRGFPAFWLAWRRQAALFLVSGILPGLLVIYNAWMAWNDPYIAAWNAQNRLPSPHPLHYLLAFGLVLPYAWVGGRRLLRGQPWEGWLPVGWVVAALLLAYVPVNVQRRLPDGIWVGWVTLAMAALSTLSGESLKQLRKRRLATLPLWLLFLTTLFLLAGGLFAVQNPAPPLFRTAAEVAVFEHLQAQAAPGSVVLAADETSNALPAWAPVFTLLGHGPESIHSEIVGEQVQAFYQSETPDSARLEFLERYEVRYVFWGQAERALGDWDAGQASYLRPVFAAGDYYLFEVITGHGDLNWRNAFHRRVDLHRSGVLYHQ